VPGLEHALSRLGAVLARQEQAAVDEAAAGLCLGEGLCWSWTRMIDTGRCGSCQMAARERLGLIEFGAAADWEGMALPEDETALQQAAAAARGGDQL